MWSYRPQLDGLRSIAVYLVLLYHCGPAAVGGGFIGVDVFFVLSGFLVSSVILDEIERTGSLRLGAFYARRVRRLLPAAVLVIVATCLVFVLVAGLIWRLEIISDARAALLYVANWHFLAQANDYFSDDQQPSPFLHFWSLSIEEQFYVFFPVLLVLLNRVERGRVRRMALAVAGLGAASLAAQLFWMARDTNHAYYGTDARLYQLLAGVLLAIAWQHRHDHLLGRRVADLAPLLGAAGLLVLGSGLLDLAPGWRGIGATVATVAVIAGIMARPEGWVGRALSRPTLVYLGKISYGTYLWHWPVILVLRQLLTLGSWELVALAVPVSTGLAALSFQVFETPIRRTPRLQGLYWPVVAGGLALSVVVAAVVVAPVLETTRRPVVAMASGPASGGPSDGFGDQAVPTGIDWKAQVHDNGHSVSCAADDVDACVVVRGKGPTVLLVGDSFANMFGPMFVQLAKDHDLTLAQNVVQGCPWPEDLDDTSQSTEIRAQCEQARDEWYDKALRSLKPDLVVMVMRPRDDSPVWVSRMKSRSGKDYGSLASLTVTTMRDTVHHLEKLVPQITLVQGVLGAGHDRPLDCLASAQRLGDCEVTVPSTSPPSDGYMESLAAESDHVSTININKIVCPTAPRCLPYRDGQIVWRDRFHLMTGFATSKRAEIWKLMADAGALQRLR